MKLSCRKALLVGALCSLAALASDVDGRWSGEMRLTVPRIQTRDFSVEFKSDASGRVIGTISHGDEKVDILDGRFDHDEIFFGVPTGAQDMTRFEFRGTIESDTITFSISGLVPRSNTLIKLGEATVKRAQ